MKKVHLYLLATVPLMACRVPMSESVTKNDTQEDPVLLGFGYDTDILQVKQTCVTGTPQTAGGAAINYTFQRVESIDTVARSLGFETQLSFAYGVAKAKATANFAQSLSDTTFSATYLFSQVIQNEVSYLNSGVNLVDGLPVDNPTEFRQRCGNSYVSKIKTGGQLLAAVTFIFGDKQSKDEFNGTFSLGVNTIKVGVEASQTVSRMVSEAKQNATLKIEFNQRGGTPASIAQAFPSGKDAVICNLSNRESCQQLIASLFNYATQVFPREVQSNPVVFSAETTPYPGVRFPELAPEVASARNATVKALRDTAKDRKKVSDLLAAPIGYGTAERRTKLLGISESITENMRTLQENIINCVERADASCLTPSQLELASYDSAGLVPVGAGVVTGAIGGDGGGASIQRCEGYVVGFWGESGSILDRAGAICDNGMHHPTVGSRNAGPFDVQCPAGAVLTGLRANREIFDRRPIIGSLIMECTSLESLKATPDRPGKADAVVFSGNEPQIMQQRCPNGKAAVAVHFRSGSSVDAIALECASVL